MIYGEGNVPGAAGNLRAGVDLPFGGGGAYRTIQQQYRPGSQDRQRIPDPIRVFPQNEPGREGAINVQFQQAMILGMPGNYQGLLNAQFFGGPQMAQATAPGQPLGKPQIGGGAPNIPLTPEERERLLQPGSPAPPDLRERFGIPKAEMPYGFQNKYVS
jgi:hypothetical protein